MQFSGAFWAAIRGFHMSSHAIDNLLSQEGTTLEDVLNEDSVVQEMRNQNQKLMDFLKPEFLETLIEYVTVFPSDSESKKRTQNHPFVACEMLSEPGPVHDKILSDENLLKKLFSFLECEKINSTLAGYFSKVVQAMLNRNSEKTIEYIFASFPDRDQVSSRLIQHLYSKSIVDVVVKILVSEREFSENLIAARNSFISQIIQTFVDKTEYVVFFASSILVEILNKSTEIVSWRSVREIITSETHLRLYCQSLVSEDSFKVNASALVLKTILTLGSKDDFPNELSVICASFVEVLPRLKEKLETKEPAAFGTFGEEYEPLGEQRLRIVELISLMVKTDEDLVIDHVVKSEILTTIVDLFFKMIWNSMFHNVVDGLVVNCLNTKNDDLIHYILLKTNFVERMIKINIGTKHRVGNLGLIHKLANYLNKVICGTVRDVMGSVEGWNDYLKDYLETRNKIDTSVLGDINKRVDDSSSENDLHDGETGYYKSDFSGIGSNVYGTVEIKDTQKLNENEENTEDKHIESEAIENSEEKNESTEGSSKVAEKTEDTAGGSDKTGGEIEVEVSEQPKGAAKDETENTCEENIEKKSESTGETEVEVKEVKNEEPKDQETTHEKKVEHEETKTEVVVERNPEAPVREDENIVKTFENIIKNVAHDKPSISIDDEPHKGVKIVSPRMKPHTPSPKADIRYNCATFWALSVGVDELEDLD